MGLVFQQLNLFRGMNVEDNILVPWYIKKQKVTEQVRSQLVKYLDLIKLGDIRKKTVNTLSGGEQQRVAIVRALLTAPSFILCDEPTANLDKENTKGFMTALVDIQKETGATIVIASHDEGVIQKADMNLVLDSGRIEQG